MPSPVSSPQPCQAKLADFEKVQPERTGLILVAAVLGGYWLLLINQLRVDWSINPQYYYGWVVPLLAFGAFRLRWLSRPAAAPMPVPASFLWLAGLMLGGLLPARLIEEANPEWRLVLWAHSAQMVVLTLAALYYAGGWPWARHCAFPICFFLVAVPWPVPVEQFVIQGLMRNIAAVTVELVELLNIPALQHGNLIQISTGVVGIDEACSGVRSVQTTLFISLFLGELYRFSFRRRIALILGSLALALAGNVGRTTFLVWTAAERGLGVMQRLHDTAGMTALVGTLITSWLLALLLRGRSAGLPPLTFPKATTRHLPRTAILWGGAWLLCSEAATETWYRSHEWQNVQNSRWSINWPTAQSRFAEIPISEEVHSILRYSTGREVSWEDETGDQWLLFMLRWEPGRNSAQLATAHTPDICLQAAGWTLVNDLGVRPLPVNGLVLPIRQSIFSKDGKSLHVFYCLWEDRPSKGNGVAAEEGALSIRGRLLAVLEGRRHLGQQVLEVAVQGPADTEEAAALFKSQILRLVHRDDHTSGSGTG